MKNKMRWISMAIMVLAACSFPGAAFVTAGHDDDRPGRHTCRCTTSTASGTYGYRMAGSILGVGPFLVNGLFTHNTDGTMNADVQLVVGPQTFPGAGTGGEFKINSDCTGSGKFKVESLNLDVTYNFIATDDGEQIDLLNTNPGIVLHGYGRRISRAGKSPRCSDATVFGTYGYRLEGSLPNAPLAAAAGIVTHSLDDHSAGVIQGADTLNIMGQYFKRELTGSYKLERNCRGTGSYTDTLGAKINYVFTAVDGGDTVFVQGADPGTAISGVGRRVK
jgi:hypothetical protein